MFIKVDKPIPGVKLKSVKQLLPKAGKYLHLLVDSDNRDELENDWRDWFHGKESEDPHAMDNFSKFRTMLNPVSSFPEGCDSMSSLCLKGETELLNHMIERKPITVDNLQSVEGVIGGLIAEHAGVSIYDRYLLKHGADRLLKLDDTELDRGPLNNLIVLLKALNKKPPQILKIYSEFFQIREFRNIDRKSETEGSSMSKWKGIIQGNQYEGFVRSLMEALVVEIRSLYPGLGRTQISLYDCTRQQYKDGALPHDRYLELNQIVMVSTAGFNFEVKDWNNDNYVDFTSKGKQYSKGKEIRPTMLIPIAHMGKPPLERNLVKFTAGLA